MFSWLNAHHVPSFLYVFITYHHPVTTTTHAIQNDSGTSYFVDECSVGEKRLFLFATSSAVEGGATGVILT